MKRKMCLAVLIAFSLLISEIGVVNAAPVSTEIVGKKIVKEYVFYSDTISNVKVNEAKEKIEYKGKKYELADVSYEKIGRKVKVTKLIDRESKGSYPNSIEGKNYAGETIKLTADGRVKWEKVVDDPVTKTVTYTGSQNIPDIIYVNKNGRSVTASKTNEARVEGDESFTAPAVFYGEADEDYYFNGKYITIGSKPTWDGYEKDVMEYLQDGSIKSIGGGRWVGEAYRRDDGRLVRNAVFYGTKSVPVTRATYVENESSRTHYRAEITYHNPDEDGEYVVKAVCTYAPYKEQKKSDDTVLKMLAGAGILVLAIAFSAALIYLATRKKLKKKQNQ